MASWADAWLAIPGNTPTQQMIDAGYAFPPVADPAASTWTPDNLNNLAQAWVDQGNAPTQEMVAAGLPATPVFDPYADISYAAGASAVQSAGTHAQAHHDYNAASGQQNLGYDTEGRLINTSANSNYNPFSQAMVLQRNYDNTKRGTVNSYASQGQLYSGAIKNQQKTDAYNYDVADDRLKRAASDYFHNNDYSLTQTQDSGAMTLAQLLGPAFSNFLAAQRGS